MKVNIFHFVGLPFLFLFIAISLFVFRHVINMPGQILSYATPFIIIVLITIFKTTKYKNLKIDILLYIYFVYIIVSSILNYNNISFSMIITHFTMILIIYISINQFFNKRIDKNIQLIFNYFSLGLIILFVVIMAKGYYYETESGVLRLTTDVLSGNTIARNYLLLFWISILSIINIYNKKYLKLLYFIIIFVSLYVILLTFSKSTFVITIFTLLLYLQSKYKILSFKFILLLMFVCILIITITLNTNIYENINLMLSNKASFESLLTFSARFIFWQEILELINHNIKSFVFGYGPSSSVLVLANVYIPGEITQAHNAIIHSMLEVGLIGTIIYNLFIYFNIKNANLLYKEGVNKDFYLFIRVIHIGLLLKGITEGAYSMILSIEFYLIIIFYLYLKIKIKQEKVIYEKL